MTPIRYWLLKSEPASFSIDDLAASPKQTTCWDGVRNFQARNFIRDDIKLGDRVLFYHSSAEPPAVVGVAVITREAYPDPTAWDPNNEHYDPKASPRNPTWMMIDIKLEQIFAQPLALESLRSEPVLAKMELLRKGSRLSVQPVTAAEFETVMTLAARLGPPRTSFKSAGSIAERSQAARATSATTTIASRAAQSRPKSPASPKSSAKPAAKKPADKTPSRKQPVAKKRTGPA